MEHGTAALALRLSQVSLAEVTSVEDPDGLARV